MPKIYLNTKNLILIFFTLFLIQLVSFLFEKNSLLILSQFETSTLWQNSLDSFANIIVLACSLTLLILSLFFDFKIIIRLFFIIIPILSLLFLCEDAVNYPSILHKLIHQKEPGFMLFFYKAPFLAGKLLVSKVLSLSFFFFFFAYMNRYFSFRQLSLFYPLCVLLNLLAHYLFFDLSLTKKLFLSFSFSHFSLILLLGLACFLLFEILPKNEIQKDTQEIEQVSLLKIAAPFICLSIASSFTFFFDQIGSTGSFEVANAIIKNFPPIMPLKTVAILLQSGGLLFLVSTFFFKKSQAWKNFFLGSLSTILVIAILFFYYNLSFENNFDLRRELSENEELLGSMTVGLGYEILMLGVTAPLFFCLKELSLQLIPRRFRLTCKIILDLLYGKVGLFFGLLFIQGSLFVSSTSIQFFILSAVFVLSCFILSLYSAFKLGKIIEKIA